MNKSRRTYAEITFLLIVAAGLIVLTIFLSALQNGYAIQRQSRNSSDKLEVARHRISGYAAEVDLDIETYRLFCQSKLDVIAFFLDENPDYGDRLGVLASQWGLENVYLFSGDGQVVYSSTSSVPDDVYSLAEDMNPITSNGRYYLASRLADGRVVAGSINVQNEIAHISEMRSLPFALSDIKVGAGGFIFCVNTASGIIEYYPSISMTGISASESGIPESALEDGFSGYITLDGQRHYAMTVDIGGDLALVAVVPEDEMSQSVRPAVTLCVAAFAIVMLLITLYASMLKRQDEASDADEKRVVHLGNGLYFNKTLAGKVKNIVVMGVVVMFMLAYYSQSLVILSRQFVLSQSKAEEIVDILAKNDERLARILKEYSDEYAQRAYNIAFTINEDPRLLSDDKLETLCERAQVTSIYAFDENGKTDATSSPFKDFALSDDPTSQSYPFWQVVKGYQELLVQDARLDDTAQHNYFQYIGVRRMDKKGMIQLCLSPKRIQTAVRTTDTDYVLGNIAAENDGFIFAVDEETGKFISYPNEKYISRDAREYGLGESALTDGYYGYQTVDARHLFVVSTEYDGAIVCLATPTEAIFDHRFEVALIVTLASFIMSLMLMSILTLSRKVEKAGDGKKTQGETQAKFFQMVMPGGTSKWVQSAFSRWSTVNSAWGSLSPEMKLQKVIFLIIGALAIIVTCAVTFARGKLETWPLIDFILDGRWDKTPDIFSFTYIIIIVTRIFVYTWIARRVIVFLTKTFGARSETIGRLVDNFIKYVALIAVLFYALVIFGIDTTALMTSAGILTLIVGLGAQSLISDILAGIFIVFEGEFRVGDIVTIDGWSGTVMEIGIRTTKIASRGQDIKILNNSSISGVVNMTKQYSYASVTVGIDYGESLERVEGILAQELPDIKKRLPAIIDGPFYKGVSQLADSSVNITVVAQCRENDRAQLARDLNREIKLMFDRRGINIPFPQVVVNRPRE
ncbi:MAG: mechanosensitive ion channel [Clostridia bacterium]|nr:mechanosensitive ion channel [Clostridia bacterium]